MNVSTPASALPSPSSVVAINSTTVPSPVAPSPVTPAAVPSSSSVEPTPSPLVLPSPSTTPSVPSSNFPAISPSSVQAGSPFADDILLFFLVALLISVCLRWVCRTRTNKAAQQYNRIDDPFDVETELVGVKTQIPEIPEPELPEENTV